MAKVRGACFSLEARGKVGEIIFEQRARRPYAKIHHAGKMTITPEIAERQGKYGLAVQVWRNLTPAEKKTWKNQAKGKKMSGFNLFMQWFLNIPKISVYGVGIYGANNYG